MLIYSYNVHFSFSCQCKVVSHHSDIFQTTSLLGLKALPLAVYIDCLQCWPALEHTLLIFHLLLSRRFLNFLKKISLDRTLSGQCFVISSAQPKFWQDLVVGNSATSIDTWMLYETRHLSGRARLWASLLNSGGWSIWRISSMCVLFSAV